MVTDTDIQYAEVNSELEYEILFDPNKISIVSKVVSTDYCLRRFERGAITLSPDFERNEVWTIEKKCRLIESLMLKIPIPMFYVAADEKDNYAVVDGLQRLGAIRDFILGKEYLKTKDSKCKGEGFRLKYLEFLSEYDGKNFNELPAYIKNRILETAFTFTIINPGTPEEAKRSIFKRINTGGEPLKPQEIRHVLYIGKSTRLLHRLSQKDAFLTATGSSLKPKRMVDKEFILRLLAFLIRKHDRYPINSDMDKFLSDTMRIINIFDNLESKQAQKLFKDQEKIKAEDVLITSEEHLEHLFEKAMIRAYEIFGEHAFRKSYEGKRRTRINKSLLEVWGVLFSQITNEEFEQLKLNKKRFLSAYKYILKEAGLNRIISKGSLKYNSVRRRHEVFNDFLNQFIHA